MLKLNLIGFHKIGSKLKQYLHKNYQCFSQYPNLFLMRKLARFELIRRVSCYFPTNMKSVTKTTLNSSSLFKELDTETIVTSLQKEGCYFGLQLPDDTLQELLDFASKNYCYVNRDPNQSFMIDLQSNQDVKVNKNCTVGSYLDTHLKCDAFQQIKNDPVLLEIAQQYLQKPAVYLTSELCWSFPNQSSYSQMRQDAQVFHYDIDDYRAIKFFFYLTDVDEVSGAHVCILKSHYNKQLWHQIIGQHCASISDSELIEVYGAENVIQIYGEKGFGFVEDTFCFHKGTMPNRRSRLLLQVEFTTNYYKNPRAYM